MAKENPQNVPAGKEEQVEYTPAAMKKQIDRIEHRVATLAASTERRARKDVEAMKGVKKVKIVYPNGTEEICDILEVLIYSLVVRDGNGEEAFVQKANTRKIVILERENKAEEKK
jgi:hypothetical protein